MHPANIQDRDGAKLVIDKLTGRFPRMRLVWADAGYAGKLIEWVWALTGWALEIVKRPRDSHRVFSLLIDRFGAYESERYVGSRGVSPEGSCDVTVASYSQQANHRVSYGGKYLGRRLSSYLTAIFVKCDVLNPMQSVLDAPMLSRQFQQPSGSSLVRSKACHRIRDVPARFGPSAHRSLDSTYLRHVRPVGVPTQNL